MIRLFYVFVLVLTATFVNSGCESNNNITNINSANEISLNDTKSKLTKDMVYSGINNYCHQNFDWSIAKDNPDMMYVEMGKETDDEYEVIFRSYTGSFTYFFVNKSNGKTRIVEYVPALDIREESGTINIFDYLDKNN